MNRNEVELNEVNVRRIVGKTDHFYVMMPATGQQSRSNKLNVVSGIHKGKEIVD